VSADEQMGRLTIEISQGLQQAVRLPPEEVSDRLKRELAVRLYEKELLTFGQARRLSGISRWEFHELLGVEGIVRHYTEEDLEEDIRYGRGGL
jgi:predicted HTH domain antitoxin